MSLSRRDFLKLGSASAAGVMVSRSCGANAASDIASVVGVTVLPIAGP